MFSFVFVRKNVSVQGGLPRRENTAETEVPFRDQIAGRTIFVHRPCYSFVPSVLLICTARATNLCRPCYEFVPPVLLISSARATN